MSYDKGLAEWMCEALAPMGEVSVRRMFGGAGVYLDGTIFALLGLDDLWFKAGPATDAQWDALSPERFTVEMRGKPTSMNYRRAPSDAHDDAEAMQRYAALALEAGGAGGGGGACMLSDIA